MTLAKDENPLCSGTFPCHDTASIYIRSGISDARYISMLPGRLRSNLQNKRKQMQYVYFSLLMYIMLNTAVAPAAPHFFPHPSLPALVLLRSMPVPPA